jgi:hypothetical protein
MTTTAPVASEAAAARELMATEGEGGTPAVLERVR